LAARKLSKNIITQEEHDRIVSGDRAATAAAAAASSTSY
jgi:hypothetical protein